MRIHWTRSHFVWMHEKIDSDRITAIIRYVRNMLCKFASAKNGTYYLMCRKCVICTAYLCVRVCLFLSLVHFLKSLCVDLFCFVSFQMLSSSGCLEWWCYCCWYYVFIPLSIHRLVDHAQISNCTHFIQMNFCVWVLSGENLMCTNTAHMCAYRYVNYIAYVHRLPLTVRTEHAHTDVYGSAAQETEWSSTKVVLFRYFSVRLSFDCCECLCMHACMHTYVYVRTENWARFAFGQ